MKKKSLNAKKENLLVKKPKSSWEHRRNLLSRAIPLEVDLENRQLFFTADADQTLSVDFKTDNLDTLISSYLQPKESKKVMDRLLKAEKGLEKPIPFQFVHPVTSKAFHFEYRYKIVYVKYSSTRLQGELVKTRAKQIKK